MGEFTKILKGLATSPSLYIYWAVSAAGSVANHFNQGLSGSPALGAAAIACTFLGIVIFYLHLKALRDRREFSPKRSAIRLFFSIYGFRLRLLLLFVPVMAAVYWLGFFDSVTNSYIRITIGGPDDRWRLIFDFLKVFAPIIPLVWIFLALDQAGRSLVVAQGNGMRAIRSCLPVVWQLRLPITLFLLAETLLFFLNSTDFGRDSLDRSGVSLAIGLNLATTPFGYALQMGMLIYMAERLRGRERPNQ